MACFEVHTLDLRLAGLRPAAFDELPVVPAGLETVRIAPVVAVI